MTIIKQHANSKTITQNSVNSLT